MSAQRALLVFAADTDSMEDLQHALSAMQSPPWKPNPPGTRYGAPQERYTEAEVDEYVTRLLRRSAGRLHFEGSVIVPTQDRP